MKKIPFNQPSAVGAELANIADALARGHLSGDGYYSKRCHQWLEQRLACKRALLTHSCTGALDMAAILCDLKPGDEVIMPSYTFVSTANAFAMRGAVPVFIDMRAGYDQHRRAPDRSGDHAAHACDCGGALCGAGLRNGHDHGDRRAP